MWPQRNVLQEDGSDSVTLADSNQKASDLSLVAGIRAGDDSAMAQLYDRYSSIVYAVALRVLGDTGAAEDVLQDVFMQLWRRPAQFDSTLRQRPAEEDPETRRLFKEMKKREF